MGAKRVDLVGKKCGCYTVLEEIERDKHGKRRFTCSCDCGNICTVTMETLRKNRSSYCSKCRPKTTQTGAYKSWEAMLGRCYNKNNTHFEYYGGRGIKVCDAWRNSFSAFFEDMGDRPKGLSLDRIDSEKDYSKENCRWATRSVQSYNTRKQKNNTSGKTGVVWSEKEKRWIARISYQGKDIRLGAFIDIEDAISARQEAEVLYFGKIKI